MRKKVLVIGGAGYIGSHTVVELINSGYVPVIVDNFVNSDRSVLENINRLTGQKVKCYELYFSDERLAEILDDEKPVGVIHFAAHKAVGESVENPLKYYENNVSGMIKLAKLLVDKKIESFVFSSSAAVYGNPPTEKVDEETICRPTSPYGWTKYMDEIVLKDVAAAHKLKVAALRYFNVVGGHESSLIGEFPKGKPQNLVPIITQAIVGKIPPLTVFGDDYPTKDGTCLRDYIHVVDLAKAHISALEFLIKQDGGLFEAFNVGTGKPSSVLEVINEFESSNKVKIPYSIGPRRPGDPVACYAANDKIKQMLGWAPTKTLKDSVMSAWQWQQKIS